MSKSYSSCYEVNKKRHNGFTLVELMVVVLIIGLMLGFIVMSVNPHGQDDQLKEESTRLMELIRLASEEAILQSRVIGVKFRPAGYSFYTYVDDTASTDEENEPDLDVELDLFTLSFEDSDVDNINKNKWIAIEGDDVLRPRKLVAGIQLVWKVEGDESASVLDLEADEPQVLIFSSGEMTPFEVSFLFEENIYYVITGSMVGGMKLTRPDEESL